MTDLDSSRPCVETSGAAYPIRSVTVLTLDVLVIYALTVHGGQLRDSTR